MEIKSKRGIVFFVLLIFMLLFSILTRTAYAQSNQLTIKFHSTGEGKNVTLDLTRYLPVSEEYIHSEVENVRVIIRGHFATIIPNFGWVGSETVTISSNKTLIEEISRGLIEPEKLVNLEPVIEMSFPSVKEFGVSPGKIEFTVIAYDPDNDMLTVDWLINGVVVKTERREGGIISHFTFNKTATKKIASILKGHVFTEKFSYYVINSIINDSRNSKVLEWRLNIVNQTCSDLWSCKNWSECIGGKRYRGCVKINEECEATGNKPATEWIDPLCIMPTLTCQPIWLCGNWSDCKIDYDVGLITHGELASRIKTKRERLCYDTTYCIGAVGLETHECGRPILINMREVTWCNQSYIEIFNHETGQFISRIKKYKIGEEPSLDIDLSLKELKQEDYCWYCYNTLQDYDETSVDCGGSCPECFEISLGPEFRDILRFSLFLLADLLLVIYIFMWIRRR